MKFCLLLLFSVVSLCQADVDCIIRQSDHEVSVGHPRVRGFVLDHFVSNDLVRWDPVAPEFNYDFASRLFVTPLTVDPGKTQKFYRLESTPSARHWFIWVFLGQSNMVGHRLTVDYATLSDSSDADIPFAVKAGTFPDAMTIDSEGWSTFQDDPGYGPELATLRSLALDGYRVAGIKYAANGTSLYSAWREGGPLYQAAVDYINLRLSEFLVEGDSFEIIFFWLQGTADGWGIDTAEAYSSNLHALASRLRRDVTGASDGAFVVADHPAEWSARTYAAVVADQQGVFAGEDPKAVIISTDGTLPRDNPAIHYDFRSFETLGIRAAEAWDTRFGEP